MKEEFGEITGFSGRGLKMWLRGKPLSLKKIKNMFDGSEVTFTFADYTQKHSVVSLEWLNKKTREFILKPKLYWNEIPKLTEVKQE